MPKALDKVCPRRSKKGKKKKNMAWWTTDLHNMRRNVDNAFNEYRNKKHSNNNKPLLQVEHGQLQRGLASRVATFNPGLSNVKDDFQNKVSFMSLIKMFFFC